METSSTPGGGATAGEDRRGVLRNPFVWAFFIGIVTITALTPLLRREPEPPPVLGTLDPYTLIDQSGNEFGSADLAGDVYVASFFFTNCPTICPRLIDAMTQLDDRYRSAGVDEILLISISVDPGNDTPERLAEYADRRGLDFDRWRLLTGDAEDVRAVVEGRGGFMLAMGDPETSPGGKWDIAHSGKLVIVDGEGRIRGYYDVLERDDRYPGLSTAMDVGVDEVFHRSRAVLEEEKGTAY